MIIKAAFTAVFLFSVANALAVEALPDLTPITRPTPIPVDPCLRGGTMTYWVRARAKPGDGSQKMPFPTIQQALAVADQNLACNLDIHVSVGTYSGNLNISRNTRILGEGASAPVLTGSILNSKGQTLVIHFFNIAGAADIALSQSGGTLELRQVTVSQTRRRSPGPEAGTAVMIKGGAQVVIEQGQLTENEGQALWISDPGTRVLTNGLRVEKNKVNPAAMAAAASSDFSHSAAIEVTNDATLLAQNFSVTDNEFIGVLLHQRARAHFRQGTVSGTLDFANSSGIRGGNNFQIMSKAALELHGFVSERAQGFGVIVQDGYLTASTGQINNNVDGIAFMPPLPQANYDIGECFAEDISFQGNGVVNGGAIVPLPSVCNMSPPPPQCSQPPNCAFVPWSL